MSTYGKFYFRPMPGEQISTELTLYEDSHAAICGRVLDRREEPVSGAVVLLFLPGPDDSLSLVSRFVTDEDGHFIFGPLDGNTLYLIKVFKDEIKLRELEIFTDTDD
ncbi:MAG TPA: hypothetical protein DD735_01525 [Clostridiales bacterium]|nr:hypothetical protein [Clostridiales bacterium]